MTAGKDTPPPLPQALLPLRAVTIEMRFTQATLAGPYHQPGLAGYLKSLLHDTLPAGLWLTATDNAIPRFAVGDRYRFAIYALPNALDALDRILDGLRRAPSAGGDAKAFGPRWRFSRAMDALADDHPTIGRAADLAPLTAETITSEAAYWAQFNPVRLRWLSPVQLLRAKSDRSGKGQERYCRDATDIDGDLLLTRLINSLQGLMHRLGAADSLARPDAQLTLSEGDWFWHGASQISADGSEKPVYGLSGITTLAIGGPDADTLWAWLVLGQHLGIGQRRGFGLGRYRLETAEGLVIGEAPRRRASLLTPALTSGNLENAWRAIADNKRRVDFHNELSDALAENPMADGRSELVKQAQALQRGDYHPPALYGILIPKGDGEHRALAVPPLFDRVLQRAVAQMLNEIIEPLMHAQSFGYRVGRNRMQARDRIQSLVRQGYDWFFEADIDNFFDSVSAERVGHRLQSLLTDDPVIDLILQWISAPVRYQNQTYSRTGLPQGSPLSPLLANLVLDDFDHDLSAAGFQPVRFADDFVIPCRSREQAEAAAERVRLSLAEKGLRLNADQSRVGRFADGLKFLGYRFINDLAVPSPRRRARSAATASTTPAVNPWADLSANAAQQTAPLAIDDPLAAVDPSLDDLDDSVLPLPAAVFEDDPSPATAEPSARPLPDSLEGEAVGEAGSSGTVVIVSTPNTLLHTRDGRLWRQTDDDEDSQLLAPWPQIGAIVLIGFQRITQAAMSRAMDHQAPLYFTDGMGRLRGRLVTTDSMPPALWRQQEAAVQDPQRCLAIARSLVRARIDHQRLVLRRRGIAASAIARLSVLSRDLRRARSLDSLRGLEGQASRFYFERLAAVVPEWVAFHGRNRRPPRDPLNVLLSLGYTVLYCHCETLLHVAGLLPSPGFYHQSHGRHAALASDQMEPFRHLVETTALTVINRRQLKAADFTQTDDGCRLAPAARNRYLTALAHTLSHPMSDRQGNSASAHEHLYAQLQSLVRHIEDPDMAFDAVRLK